MNAVVRQTAIASRLAPTGPGAGHKNCGRYTSNVGASLLAMGSARSLCKPVRSGFSCPQTPCFAMDWSTPLFSQHTTRQEAP
ncbi:hypothetical protein SAMN03159293_03983 [Pseudomonas sp. NFACC39-1]|nr:hypothetical protein SAMN03159293_03983 [Pseudomonas sp. NFACC39-1]